MATPAPAPPPLPPLRADTLRRLAAYLRGEALDEDRRRDGGRAAEARRKAQEYERMAREVAG